MDNYGILSIVPSILIVVLAWKSREILLSLFIGVFTGVMILNNYNPLVSFLRTADTYILNSLADGWNAAIIILILALGGVIGIVTKSGGTQAIGEKIASKAKTTKNAKLASFILGLAIFYDDYSNTLIVGNTMRPITDKLDVPREKLSYLVDTTAAAVTSLIPISTWIAYEVGLINDTFSNLGIEEGAYGTFVKSVPYMYYSIFALALAVLVVLRNKDFGGMYTAEVRAYKEKKVLRDGATPLSSAELENMTTPKEGEGITWIQAFIPIISIAVITVFGLWWNGGGPTGIGVAEAFGNADSSVVLIWASFGGSVIAAVIAKAAGKLSFSDIMDSWVEGAKSMVIATFILILAWSVGSITSELGTADFVVGIAEGNLPIGLIPAVIFIIAAFISFTTGSSWGTMAILMPISIPLAFNLGGALIPTIAATFTGSIWGDHCSPISDTTIMSSMSSGCDHIDHVKTQMPYAMSGAVVALLFGFIPAGFGISWLISLPVGIVAIYLILQIMGKSIEPKDLDKIKESQVS